MTFMIMIMDEGWVFPKEGEFVLWTRHVSDKWESFYIEGCISRAKCIFLSLNVRDKFILIISEQQLHFRSNVWKRQIQAAFYPIWKVIILFYVTYVNKEHNMWKNFSWPCQYETSVITEA